MRNCEIDRVENDVLDVAESVPARQLGDGGIRFSSMPELGGDAYVLELRPNRDGGARVSFTWLYGHRSWRWLKEGRRTFDISSARFREFGEIVDGAMARVRPVDPNERENLVVCTDGPGFLTERVRSGVVTSMTGFCPPRWGEEHPNRTVEAAALGLICPRFREEFNPGDGIGAACVRRDRRLRNARR